MSYLSNLRVVASNNPLRHFDSIDRNSFAQFNRMASGLINRDLNHAQERLANMMNFENLGRNNPEAIVERDVPQENDVVQDVIQDVVHQEELFVQNMLLQEDVKPENKIEDVKPENKIEDLSNENKASDTSSNVLRGIGSGLLLATGAAAAITVSPLGFGSALLGAAAAIGSGIIGGLFSSYGVAEKAEEFIENQNQVDPKSENNVEAPVSNNSFMSYFWYN